MSDFDLSGFLLQFFEEAKERLSEVNRRLVLLESGNLDQEGLAQLCRDAHTIKGSAEMLGATDISALSHLLEEAVAVVMREKLPSGSHPMTQFLFDLHDRLQERLLHPDNESRIDTEPFEKRFQALCAELDAVVKATSNEDKDNQSATKATQLKRRPRKSSGKKVRVNRNIIAAVMGSIEGSLEENRAGSSSKNKEAEKPADAEGIENTVKEDEVISFRPELKSLEAESEESSEESSGNFLRVDKSRLSRLSNQIIELSSDRYRGSSLEDEYEVLMLDLKLLRQQLFENRHDAPSPNQKSEFDQRLRQMHKLGEQLRLHQKRSASMLDDLRNQVFGLMLRPIASLFSVFPRTVRDLASRSGKKVQLLISGDAIEMDQLAAAALSEPLIHLINNAVAHGIEAPEERIKADKPEEAQITIVARQMGAEVTIEVVDDGRGIDVELLREKAEASGIISSSEAEEMNESEILELIFHPGFSTLSEANENAGRGIGLNVVVNAMRELTGSVHIQTQSGKGTKFILNLPVSVAIQKANAFTVAGQQFGMLSNLIKSTLPLDQQQIKTGQGAFHQGYINFDGHRVPIIDLYPVLKSSSSAQQGSNIMIVEHFEGYLGILVDEVLDEREIIVREIDPYLKFYQPVGLMGNAIAEDGTVLLLIEPNGLKEMWRTSPEYEPDQTRSDLPTFNQRVLLVDDSSIALKIEKMMFESLGFSVDTAVGGMDAIEKISLHEYQLLVTDMKMPGIDGVDLIEKLKAQKAYRDIPVLVIATHEAEPDRQRALNAGADAFLGKRQMKGHQKELAATLVEILGIDAERG